MQEIDLLDLIHSSRSEHGIAHSDHLRYSRHNSNKIRNCDSIVKKLLFKAERNWAFALECKKHQGSRKRYHGVKKLNRAIEYSKKILELTVENEWDNMIARAYSLGLEGLAGCERRRWEDGIKALTNARSIYAKLQQSPKSSRHEHYLQVSIDELDPLIKYCAYQIKLKTGAAVDMQELLDMKRFIGKQHDVDGLESQLDKLLAESSKAKDNLGGIEWRSQSIQTNSSEWLPIWDSLQNSKAELETEMSKTLDFMNKENVTCLLESFQTLLGVLWDASRLAEAQLKEYQAESDRLKSSKSLEKMEKLEAVHGYIVFQRLFCTIQRNYFLIDWSQYKIKYPKVYKDRTKKADVVKLFNFSIQSVEDLSSISLLEKDPSLGFIIEALGHSLKGRRCLYISEIYSSVNKDAEETALVARAVEYLERAKESLFLTKELCHDDELIYVKKVAEDLDLMCISSRIRVNALNTQKSHQIEQIVENLSLENKSILDNLNAYPLLNEHSRLLQEIPKLVPIPFKPLLIDIAFDAAAKYDISNLGAAAQESPSGLMNMISGFWGSK